MLYSYQFFPSFICSNTEYYCRFGHHGDSYGGLCSFLPGIYPSSAGLSQIRPEEKLLSRPYLIVCQVLPPLQPAPPLKQETIKLDSGEVLLHKDIPIKMRDGITLYADLYQPSLNLAEKSPTIVLFAPFGKHGAVPRERFQNMGVDWEKLSKYTKWELPDPLQWCGKWQFSLLCVDPRGTWWSEGRASNFLSPEEGRDGYDIVEWIAQQPW